MALDEDDWHTELSQDGNLWGFTLTQNGIVHTVMRGYRSRERALMAADWHRAPMGERPSIADELAEMGL